MAVITPPTITSAPTATPQRGDRTTFSDRVDAFVTWLSTSAVQINAVATNVALNATDAATSATAATAGASAAAAAAVSAVATANVTRWISGTTYAAGVNVYSSIDFKTYRRTTAGTGATDPSLDAVNWVSVIPVAVTPLPFTNIQMLAQSQAIALSF